MKIGVLTFIDSYNYGASLQAYATLLLFNNKGYETEFINYRNKNEKKVYTFWGYSPNLGIKGNIKKYYNHIFRNILVYEKASFDDFYEMLPKSERFNSKQIMAYDDMKKDIDIVVIGSDQVWSPQIYGGIPDYIYWGCFTKKKLISFASSAGSYIYSLDEKKQLRNLYNRFSTITVREKMLREQLSEMDITPNVEVVLDPTLMIRGNQWKQEIINNITKCDLPNEDYLFVYFVILDFSECYPLIRKIAQEKKLKIVMIDRLGIYKMKVDYSYRIATPFDYVNLIDNAKYVITDSFHGVAFSVNLHTQFQALMNGNECRINNLLELLNISLDHYCEYDQWKTFSRIIDFEMIEKKLERERKKSMEVIDYVL